MQGTAKKAASTVGQRARKVAEAADKGLGRAKEKLTDTRDRARAEAAALKRKGAGKAARPAKKAAGRKVARKDVATKDVAKKSVAKRAGAKKAPARKVAPASRKRSGN